jgi:pyruvate/2-oxoglutarate dehydrogenase complex dihydrolipoamide acyltransferase (E2) component
MGHTAGIFASLIGDRLARVAVSAYEEAEDMWAEAHHIRQQYVFVREEKPEPESIEVTATARRQANELGVNLEEVQGTGKGGKVTTL